MRMRSAAHERGNSLWLHEPLVGRMDVRKDARVPVTTRELHLELMRELADELGVDAGDLIFACDESGAQAIECDWEDDWPTRSPRTRHGWKNQAIGECLGIPGVDIHRACQSVGVMFVQAGDRRAGSSAFFRAEGSPTRE